MEITTAMIKELRERTGAGILDCKSALAETNGDMAEAEIVVFKPLGEGKFKVVTRVASPATWSQWAK